jgi:hypothetical protein
MASQHRSYPQIRQSEHTIFLSHLRKLIRNPAPKLIEPRVFPAPLRAAEEALDRPFLARKRCR